LGIDRVCLKQKKKRPPYKRHGGSCRGREQRVTRAGQRPARREVQKHIRPREAQIFLLNFEFPWARLFQKAGSTPPVIESHNFTFGQECFPLTPLLCSGYCSKLRAPHRGSSLGPFVCGLINNFEKNHFFETCKPHLNKLVMMHHYLLVFIQQDRVELRGL
jgi:hypothetical protein